MADLGGARPRRTHGGGGWCISVNDDDDLVLLRKTATTIRFSSPVAGDTSTD
jgi:hypothetical protein